MTCEAKILTAATAAMTVGFVFAAFSHRAVASSAAYSFTMLLRCVNGEKNKTLHPLDAGSLTISGTIWVTSKVARATAEPDPITIRLYRSSLFNSEICTVTVTPDRVFNKKTSFTKSCGDVEAGTYFFIVSKPDAIDKLGDGWHIQGSGALVTK